MQSSLTSALELESSHYREERDTVTAIAPPVLLAHVHAPCSSPLQLDFSTTSILASNLVVSVQAHSHPQIHHFDPEDTEHVAPNGGTKAYLKVLGGFCVFFVTLGLASTFGSYQAYYESNLLKTSSPSTISWIGTTQVFLLSFIGTFSGVFHDWGYSRSILAIGLSLIVLGLMMLSLAQQYWQILLSQGVCVGIGSGLVYVPAVSVVSNEFTTRRAVALGFAATGSAVGGIVLPIMFRKLLPLLGWGWTNRVLAFLVFALALTAFSLLTDVPSPASTGRSTRTLETQHIRQQRLRQTTTHGGADPGGKSRQMKSILTALKGRSYLYLCIVSLGASSSYASYLLSILNAGSFFGRILPAYLSQIVGTASVLFVGALSLGAIVFAWLGIGNLPGISVWCFLVGFSSGIVVSVPNAVASRLSNPSNVGLRIGAMWTAGAFAELIGAPIAGALVKHNPKDEHDVSYQGGQIFGGLSIFVGAAFLMVPAWSILKEDRVKASRMA